MTAILAAWRLARPFLPYLAVFAALVGTYFWIDHRGYARGYAAKNAEVVAAANRLAEAARKLAAIREKAQAQRDANLQTDTDRVQERGRDLQTIVIREAANDPRYRSVECSTTSGVSDAIIAAGKLSDRSPPNASGVNAMPASAAPRR